MTEAESLAEFIVRSRFEDLTKTHVERLKILILDSLACMLGALHSPLLEKLKRQVQDFGGAKICTLVGGGRSAPDRAAFYNSALTRYLDFNDSFLAPGETCHPSDNLGAIMAAAEYANASGRDFLLALAIAYQVQCQLSEKAPVRHRGFDHVVQGAYGAACGVSRALGLTRDQTANAIAMAGTAYNALRVTRTGRLSNWKGLAFANMVMGVTHAAFLAQRGISGPLEVFEGNKGFKDSLSGPFEMDWSKTDFSLLEKVITKKFNAEIHSQSVLEGLLELRTPDFHAQKIKKIEIGIFDVAYHIIGGGEEGSKREVHSKEEADHSLPYMAAAALLDGKVLPAQYAESRIRQADIQDLLRRIEIHPVEEFSNAFPKKMRARITVFFENGNSTTIEKEDYEGFVSRPASWGLVKDKLTQLNEGKVSGDRLNAMAHAVEQLESFRVRDFMGLLRFFREEEYGKPRQGLPLHPRPRPREKTP